MIGDFYEKASLLEWKTSTVTATSLAFDRLMKSNEVIGSLEKGSNRFINHGDLGQQTLPPARFGQLFPEKNAPRISKIFDTLAPSNGETVRAIGVQFMRPGAAVKRV